MDLQDNLHVIQERIAKTDEVIRLLDVKKKEVNKLDKNYKKLIEKFCSKHTEVVNLKNECQKLNNRLTNSTEIHLPCQKEIIELKSQNERLEQNHNEYVNAAAKKYQSACQEIVTLNKACDSLNKKIEKLEHKESKSKNVKKIQQALHAAKEQLKDSILRYDELESTNNETISNLKKECKNLEERQNETLKQLAKARLDCDELKKSVETNKNSPNKSKLQQKIENLETKLQSAKIEQDILNQSHENDIAELKKQHEKEKKLLEVQLKETSKNSPNKSKFQHKIENLETNLQSAEIEQDILNQSHENDIAELKKQHEKEKKLLEVQLKELKNKINEETNTIKKSFDNDIIELKKLLDDHIKKLKSEISDKKCLNDQLEDLKNKINEEANKIKVTTGTQTDYEDIYNLEDILTEMHSLPALMSPLNSESSLKQDIESVISTCSVAVGTDDVIPTFVNSSSQTKVKSFNLSTEILNNINIQVEKSTCSVGTETNDFVRLNESSNQTIEEAVTESINSLNVNKVESIKLLNQIDTSIEKINCSTEIETIPTLTDSSTQTCDPQNVTQSKIKVRSFDLCTEVFNITDTQVENSTEISLTDSSTQTRNSIDYYQNELEFKPFEPLSKNNIHVEIPKNVKLKSRITKKYKTTNKNRVLNMLRNSKLNLKWILEKYLNTSSKFVIVSSSILKTDYNMTKTPDIDQKTERCYLNCSNTIRPENVCSCSCQQNMFYNRFGQCPVYQIPYNFNHDMYYRTNNLSNYYDMREKFKAKYKNIDDILNSSDSEEEDVNLRQVLKEYKQSIIKKYLTDKYLAKIAKKNVHPDNVESNKSNTNLFANNMEKNKAKLLFKGKLKNKLSKFNRIIYSSESEEETSEFLSNKNKSTESNTIAKNMDDDCEKKFTNLVIDKNINSVSTQNESVSNHKEINNTDLSIENNYEEIQDCTENNSGIGRNPEKGTSKESEENIIKDIVGVRTNKILSNVPDANSNPQMPKLPFILSKKQQSLLRKGKSLNKGCNVIKKTKKEMVTPNRIYATRSKICNSRKRKSSVSNEFEYKKQKQALFGSDSDSDTSTVDKSEPSLDPIDSTDVVQSLKQNETTLKSIPDVVQSLKQNETTLKSISNVESNKEKTKEMITLDITSDYSCPSSRQTRSRIALKKREIPTSKTILSGRDDRTDLSSNEIETPLNKKVFKRPGISKINMPSTNKDNIPTKCLRDVNKDSPDSPDSEPTDIFTYNTLERPSTYVMKKAQKKQKDSQILVTDSPASPDANEEPSDFILYNKLERPPTHSNQNENDRITPIDINVAQRLIKIATAMDWNKGFMANVVSYLADKNPTTVARLLVNISAQDFTQELDKTFTPPAPLLTTTQQKIIVLLSQLEKNNLPNIHNLFLEEVEKRLLSETRVEVVHPLTRLFVAVCKLKYEIEKVRMLCCHAAYYMGDLILPLMFIVLTTWGDILPMADSSEDIPLAVALVHVIHLKTCQKPGYNYMTVNRLLSDYYGYKRGERSNEEIMKQLIRSYSENYSKTAYTAIVILCKNLPHKWTYSQIKNHLLPLLENCNYSENKSMTISLIQRIISQFKMKTDQDCIVDIKNCLSKYATGAVPSIGLNN